MQASDKSTARNVRPATTGKEQKDAFITGISHDLRTPLNALLGLAQLLDASDLNQTQRSQARTILEAGRALQTVLDDVLVMMEDGQVFPDEMQDCDPTMAARAVTHLMQPVAWERNLVLSMTAASKMPRVALDSHNVRQALYKLVDNALKFTPSGRVDIRVEAIHRRDQPFVRFSVTDTGPGVPPEIGEHLYTQVPRQARYVRRRQGSGFGLLVVKRIVDAAGGLCGFDSALGEGATFWFTLPARQAEEGNDSSGKAHSRAPEGLHLLAYMGDDTSHKELNEILAPFGNTLTFARFPADLVALAVRTKFDAAIVRIDFADMLAAAPGVNVPILALVPPEMPSARTSAALAAQNWPCAAYHVYDALRSITQAPNDTGKNGDERIKPIDHAVIAALEKSVGKETLIEIFQTYIDTSYDIRKSVERAIIGPDWDMIQSLTRDVIGSASGLGLAAMTLAARNLQTLMRESADKDARMHLIRHLIDEGERTRSALVALYPELKG